MTEEEILKALGQLHLRCMALEESNAKMKREMQGMWKAISYMAVAMSLGFVFFILIQVALVVYIHIR